MSLVTPVSGFQNTILMPGEYRARATLQEMDMVEQVFEAMRTQLNQMFIQFPEHSIFPQVMSMVETMIGPVMADNPNLQQNFVESIRTTVETFMPWKQFVKCANCPNTNTSTE